MHLNLFSRAVEARMHLNFFIRSTDTRMHLNLFSRAVEARVYRFSLIKRRKRAFIGIRCKKAAEV